MLAYFYSLLVYQDKDRIKQGKRKQWQDGRSGQVIDIPPIKKVDMVNISI
jgi:hypothetical protein